MAILGTSILNNHHMPERASVCVGNEIIVGNGFVSTCHQCEAEPKDLCEDSTRHV